MNRVVFEEGEPMNRPMTKILIDGGDPQETRQVKERLGFVDGQTTNPQTEPNHRGGTMATSASAGSFKSRLTSRQEVPERTMAFRF
jgi:hypothetical protein